MLDRIVVNIVHRCPHVSLGSYCAICTAVPALSSCAIILQVPLSGCPTMQLPKAHCGATKIGNSHEQMIMIGQHTPRHALATGSSQCLHELTPKGVNPMDALAGDAPRIKVHRRDVEDGVFQRRVWRPVPRPLSPLSILQQFVPLTRTELSPDVH